MVESSGPWYDVILSAPPRSMSRRPLPIGIQSFRRIRERDCYYVDKTALIGQLIDQGDHYFLSRPRRFGKSLLLDTLQELFEGHEALFRGLAIHEHWDWRPAQAHPVLRLSFGARYTEAGDLDGDLLEQLESVERRYGLVPATTSNTGPRRLRNLLDRLHDHTGRQVVALVDEYDKPILDGLSEPRVAEANRDYLRGFYGILKDSARHVRFVLVTGVSMFSRASLFSGPNQLDNISLDPRYATLCGYTDHDLDTVFAPELPGLDRDEIRRWYNGYSWGGEETLYNPFDVLLLFSRRKLAPYWFETATPDFLYRELVRQRARLPALVPRTARAPLLSTFEIGHYPLEALLFQTGYLTIVGEEERASGTYYRLDYPNWEVELSLHQGLLLYVTGNSQAVEQGEQLLGLLGAGEVDGFAAELRAYLAGIPHPWHDQGRLGDYEAWYVSLLYMSFKASGGVVTGEEVSSRGRSDLVLCHGGQVWVIECKVVATEADTEAALERALAQIREQGYSDRYRNRDQPIHHLALCFGQTERNLVGVRVEQAG